MTDQPVGVALLPTGTEIHVDPKLNIAGVAPVLFTNNRNVVLLVEAVELFKKHRVDNLIVTQADALVGILDVQDLIKMNLLG